MFIVAWKLKLLHSLRDSLHPAHHLFELLPSGKRYKSIKTRTTRFVSSFFYPRGITILNSELEKSPPKHTSTLIINNVLSQMHFNVMEHVFCIRWQAGMNESMSEEMDDEWKHYSLYF